MTVRAPTFFLCTALCLLSMGGLSRAQPTELRVEITEENSYEDSTSLKTPLQIETNRSISLATGLNYSIICTAPSGFGNSDPWYYIFLNGTESPITHAKPASNTTSTFYVYNPSSGKYSLRFQNFGSSQGGTYRCRSPDSVKTLFISNSNPTVIMSTKVLTVLYNDNPTVPDNSHTVLVSGVPTPTFTWTLNGNNLNSSNNLGILLLKGNSEVLFTRLFSYEHAGVYAVTAINEAGNATDSFILNVHEFPRLTLTPPRNTIVQTVINNQFQVTCTDTQGFPTPVFNWFFNDTLISNNLTGAVIQQLKPNVSVLTIQNVNQNHVGSYKCHAGNEAGTDTEGLQLQILLPPPQVPTVRISSPNNPKYSGGRVNLTCSATLQTSPHFTDPLTANITWSRGGAILSEIPGRLSILTTKTDSNNYISVLSLLAAAVSDTDEYICEVKSISGEYFSASVNSTRTLLEIKVPPIPVSLSPSSIEVPNFQPYNSIVFNCSIIIPQGHSITSSFNWFMVNGASSEPLLHGHNGVRIVMGEHSSSLSFYATNAGQAKYRCSVMLGFPSPDPNITINANSTVNVIGPKSPFLPTRITAGNFAYSSAVIQWTVPSIAYSPETYFIRYGTGKSNLNLKSEVLQGTQNLNAKDQTLSITLRYLTHDTRYYFQVVSNNTNGQTESAEHEFSTSRLALLQFKAGPFIGCNNGRVTDSNAVQAFMKDEISKAVSTACSCTFPPSHLINGTILCPAANSEELILRVYVVSTETLTSAAIVSLVSAWVRGQPGVTSGVAKVTFDSSCPVNISNLQDSICTGNTVSTATPTSGQVGSAFGSNTDILVAVVAGAVILLEAVIIMILFCALWHQNSKIRTLLRRRSSTYAAVNRQNSSVGTGDAPPPPANKWKGDAYVTTECPAYLSAYMPKEQEEMMEDTISRNSPPAIYDSIDLVNGRSVNMGPPPPLPTNHPLSPPHHAHNNHATQTTLMSSETSDTEDNTGSSMMS